MPFLLLALLALGSQRLSAQQQPFQLVSINQISSTRVTRTQWDYTYTATVQNTGAAATGVTATVMSSAPSTVIVNGSLSFGSIGAGQTVTSTNTFTIEQDRTVPFELSVLSFQFQTGTAYQPPVANAGKNQVAQIGQTVTLDGSGSTDADGTIVQWAWTYSGSVPAGIAVSISNAGSEKPTVYIPAGGTFTFQLIVTDNHGLSSAPATTKVFTGPVAVPGPNQTVGVGQTVQLDGSGSFDPSGFPLTYLWTLTAPTGSKATLSSATSVNPTFVADVAGTYKATLVVNDGSVSSAPATVTITAMTGQLYCGDIVSGNITSASQVDQYVYSGTAGGVVTLTLSETSGFFPDGGVVAEAVLYDPNGKSILTFYANSQQQVTFSQTGNYHVQVFASNLVYTGTYNLGVVCRNPLMPSSALSCGGIANGSISQAAQVDQYTYTGSAGGVVTLTLSETSGFFPDGGVVAEAVLFDPTGKSLLTFYANSQQQVTLAVTGTYLIQVFSSNLVYTGGYNLGIVCRNPLMPSSALSCGGIVNGTIKQAAQVDQYTYAGSAGGVVTLTLSETSGFFPDGGVVAEAVLFDPTGKSILTFSANSQQQVTLAATGTYLVQVFTNNLVYTGTYNLGIVCRNPLMPSSALSCGGIVNGTIKQAAQVDQYTYAGSAGGVVTLTLSDTSGFFPDGGVVAEAVLFDPTGKSILTFSANSQQQVTLAVTGKYLVQVFANNLVYTGTYNLGIVCRNPLTPSSALSCGGIANGTIKQAAQVDQYTYAGSSGSVVTLTLSDTSGFFPDGGVVAEAVLFDPTGKSILTFSANSQQQVTLGVTGTYLVQAFTNNLVYTGTYNLGLVCP